MDNIIKKRRIDLQKLERRTRPIQRIKRAAKESIRCPQCDAQFSEIVFKNNEKTCPSCSYLFRMGASDRILQICDPDSFESLDIHFKRANPIDFPGYESKLDVAVRNSKADEAVEVGLCTISDIPVAFGVMNPDFMMGSMGMVVGERITRLFETATEKKLPVVLFCSSGGARMQEGLFSLYQMAKTAQAVEAHSRAGLLYISCLTDPTTGGVSASFANLGDIILAEPHALIGFAGPRVIRDTINQELPHGFQRSEYLLDHGFLDAIVERKNWRRTLGHLLHLHQPRWPKWDRIEDQPNDFVNRDPYECVTKARDPYHIHSSDVISGLFYDFFELAGDRAFAEDDAILTGLASFEGVPVTIIAQDKAINVQDNIKRNFAMPHPEGYRKAMRMMRQAEKFNRPIVTLIDTPGAYPGIGAEERGQGTAIAESLALMSHLNTPIVSLVIGEGNSGGALAIALSDRSYMLEDAVFSILSPEGFSSILWRESSLESVKKASYLMRLTSLDLLDDGFIDDIVPEYDQEGKPLDHSEIIEELRIKVKNSFLDLSLMSDTERMEARYKRYRNFDAHKRIEKGAMDV